MEGEFMFLGVHVFLLFCILSAFAVVWCELFEPVNPDALLDDKPYKPSGSYWADCMRRGDCYGVKKSQAEKKGDDRNA